MKKNLLIFLFLSLSIYCYSQISPSNYDDYDYNAPLPSINSIEKMQTVNKIIDNIWKIRKGDSLVLQLITYKELMQIHDTILIMLYYDKKSVIKSFKSRVLTDEQIGYIIRLLKNPETRKKLPTGDTYYEILGLN